MVFDSITSGKCVNPGVLSATETSVAKGNARIKAIWFARSETVKWVGM